MDTLDTLNIDPEFAERLEEIAAIEGRDFEDEAGRRAGEIALVGADEDDFELTA